MSKTENGVEKKYTYVEGSDHLMYFGNTYLGVNVNGCPDTYFGKQYVWRKGLLSEVNTYPNHDVTFAYNGFGERVSKVVGETTIEYVYRDGKLLKETRGEDVIIYIYGKEGITGFKKNGVEYVFRKNMFGDVTHIYGAGKSLVGQYEYTAFGECTIIKDVNGMATYNAIRYRGYYFDTETNLYYLKSRYYDPRTCRFVSRDDVEYVDPETINGLNLYAYCGNNPIMNVDPNGNKWWHWLIAGAGAVLAVAVSVVTCGTAVPALVGMAVGITVGIGGTIVADYVDDGQVFNGSIGVEDYVTNALMGGMIGAVAGAAIGIAPSIAATISSSATIGGSASMALSGTQVASTGLGVLAGLGIVFASDKRPGSNRKQNEQYRAAMRRLGYGKKDWQWRYGHDHLPNESLGFKDLLNFLKELFNNLR